MSVIIIICKVLGILLLSLLCILLLLLSLLLFIPVGYASLGESDGRWKIQAKLSWLFSAVSLHFHYNGDGVETFFQLFGFRLQKKKEKKPKKKKKNKTKRESERETSVPESEQNSVKDVASVEYLETLPQEEKTLDETAMQSPADPSQNKAESEQPGSYKWSEPNPETERFSEKISDHYNSARGKAKSAVQKTGDFKKKLSDKANQKAFSYIWKELVYLLKHMRFRRQKTAIEFSAGDPAATGLILGLLSVFPVLYRENSNVYPDFVSDQAYLRGKFRFRGHVRLVHVLVSATRLFLKKEFRYLMKNFIK